MTIKKFIEPPACTPADYDLPDISALQALAIGAADSDQQKRVLDWVVNQAAGTYDLDYRTDEREHAFVSGRRFVGLQIVKLLKLNLSKFKEIKNG